MNSEHETIIDQAIAWHFASEGDDMDWSAFTAWLEADSRHRKAYDEIALSDRLIEDHRRDIDKRLPANDQPMPEEVPAPSGKRGWMRWAGTAIAACLVAVLAVPQFLANPEQVYQTHASGQRIALADGSTIQLAPRSKLVIAGRDASEMTLDGGALFDIRHNPDRPLRIAAGDLSISDIGTRFDVRSAPGQIRVDVADGEVSVGAAALAQSIRLTRGRGLVFDAGAGTALVTAISADKVGEWRSGHLSYDTAPLSLVAADLSRYAGVDVTVPAALAGRQFSGTLAIGNGDAALRDLSQLMGLELGRDGRGYRLGERR